MSGVSALSLHGHLKIAFSSGEEIKIPLILLTEYSAITVTGPHHYLQTSYVADYVVLIDNLSQQPKPWLEGNHEKLKESNWKEIKETATQFGLQLAQNIKDEGVSYLWEAWIKGAPFIAEKAKTVILKGFKVVGSAPVAIITGILGDAKKLGDATLPIRNFRTKTSKGASVLVSVLGP